MAEDIAGASRADTPAITVFRVRPEQIAHGAFMRHFLEAVKHSDVVKGFNAGRKTSVQAENLINEYYHLFSYLVID